LAVDIGFDGVFHEVAGKVQSIAGGCFGLRNRNVRAGLSGKGNDGGT
jgi:hypothetical protein